MSVLLGKIGRRLRGFVVPDWRLSLGLAGAVGGAAASVRVWPVAGAFALPVLAGIVFAGLALGLPGGGARRG